MKKGFIIIALLITVAGVIAAGTMLEKKPASAPAANLLNRPAPPPPIGDTIDLFLQKHWHHPLPPQGNPPPHFSEIEASLAPQVCGACHSEQYNDWKNSLHSQTMGPGILWQLRLMPQEQANSCLNCHAPLAEQKALLAIEHQWPNAPASPPPAYVPPKLGHEGLVCAACHVREHQRFGPQPVKELSEGNLPHNGFTVSAAFEDSRFCATCHQFPEDGPRTSGKLREDTLAQWQASQYPAQQQHCQSCHMPDRKHQWQGIHSPDMVRTALSFSLSRGEKEITAAITNSGAGHHFPTYMVPKVHIELWLVNNTGHRQKLSEDVIGWQVDVSLQEESFDTRIAAGETRFINGLLPEQINSDDRIEIQVLVKPREHYERTFLSVLAQAEKLDATTLALLQQAYDEAVATHFAWTPVTQPISSLNGN